MPAERYACPAPEAAKIYDWLINRGGIFIWGSLNLANLGASWTTPARTEEGAPYPKLRGEMANEPEQHITDIRDVDVTEAIEVKRFHVAVRAGSQGLSLKVTSGGSDRIRREVDKAKEKFGKPAWYAFDYGDYNNAVIFREGERRPILEYMMATDPNAPIALPRGWSECERGNTWLVGDDGGHYALFDVAGDVRLEVSILPEDSPGFNVQFIDKPLAELVAWIHKRYDGWYVRKCNLAGVRVKGGAIHGDESVAFEEEQAADD